MEQEKGNEDDISERRGGHVENWHLSNEFGRNTETTSREIQPLATLSCFTAVR
jgi:hypothetical protein